MEANNDKNEAMRYERPTVVDYGDIFAITAANGHQTLTDAVLPAGHPISDATFS